MPTWSQLLVWGRRAGSLVRRRASAAAAVALCASMLASALLLLTPATGAREHRPPARVKVAGVHRVAGTRTEPVVRVLFVGASVTSGLEQSSLGDTYPARVVAGLRAKGLRVDWDERARSGATVADALTWPYPWDQQVIVVHLITNDFTHGTPLDTYRDGLQQVLFDLRERSPDAQLICLGTWAAPGAVNLARVSLAGYDAVAAQTCARERGDFIPLDGIFAAPGSRGPAGQVTPWGPTDAVHPNDLGAQRIADAVLATIAQDPNRA